MPKTPRDYQIEDALEARKRKKVMIRYPMGLGKSELATLTIWEPDVFDATPCLIASQNQAVPDWEDHLREEYPNARIAICAEQPPEVKRELLGDKYDFYVVNHMMLSQPKSSQTRTFYKMPKVKSFVLDECFPAGTLVGGYPIEELEAGDLVPSFDGYRTVQAVTCRPCDSLVRVILSDGRSIICTPNHPLLSLDGWIRADSSRGTYLYGRSGRGMQFMRWRGPAYDEYATPTLPREESSLLLAGMREACSAGEWETLSTLHAHARAQSEIFPANAREQSDAFSRDKNQGKHDTSSDGPQAANSRGKRAWAFSGSVDAFLRTQLAVETGIRDLAWEENTGVADQLQSGYRTSGEDDSHRSRRLFPPDLRAAVTRSAEDGKINYTRVDRVEVLESGRDGTFGGLCPDGLVYNLHVSGDHTYLVNGVIVHNSHEKGVGRKSRAWLGAKNIADRAEIVLPMSGTPIRKDSSNLWAQLRLVDRSLTSYWRFVNEHCITEETPWNVKILGSKDSMQDELASRSIYRTYAEVGVALPDVIPYHHRVKLAPDTRVLYDRLKKDLRDEFDQPVFSAGAALARLRHYTARDSAKLDRIRTLVQDLDQFVVFCWYRETAAILAKELRAVAITGADQGRDRSALAKASPRIVATIASMSTSVDLSHHRDVFFYEETYEPGVMDNALARVARWRKAGGDEPARCHYIFAEHSIDERIHNLTAGRSTDAQQVYGNERQLIAQEIAARMLQ